MTGFTKEAITNCGTCRFKASCLYSKLEPGAQALWAESRLGCKFSDGDEIFHEGQHPAGLYIVCKGRAKVTSSDARGQQLINGIRHPGSIFGHIAFFADKPYTSNSMAMGDTTVSFLEKKSLETLMSSWPLTCRVFLHRFAKEMRGLQSKIKDTAYKPARSKVARALINAISFKSRDTAAPAIHGMKRTEIAEITGLALETVVRTLQDMEKRKIIKRELKSIKILDYATLAHVADPSARK